MIAIGNHIPSQCSHNRSSVITRTIKMVAILTLQITNDLKQNNNFYQYYAVKQTVRCEILTWSSVYVFRCYHDGCQIRNTLKERCIKWGLGMRLHLELRWRCYVICYLNDNSLRICYPAVHQNERSLQNFPLQILKKP